MKDKMHTGEGVRPRRRGTRSRNGRQTTNSRKNQATLDLPMPGKKRHENDRTRILGEQLNDAPKQEREKHADCRECEQDEGWEQEEGTFP